MKKLDTKDITTIGMLSGLSILLGLTPLGMLPIGVIRITTLHIPTIIGAIIGGPIVGGIVGLIFGIFSLVQNIMAPVAISFIFWNPLVSVLPRFLIGFLSGYLYKALKKAKVKPLLSFAIVGAVGTLINTIGVLGMGYIFFANRIYETLKVNATVLLGGIALANGPAEMLASSIIVTAICSALLLNKGKNKKTKNKKQEK